MTRRAGMSGPDDTENSGDSDGSSVKQAVERLNAALKGLESAAESFVESKAQSAESGEELQRMSQDRAKLARDLDAEKARSERLAQVNGEVSRRLVGAMETVRQVLDGK